MRNGKRPARRTPVAAITGVAIDLFDSLQSLESRFACAAAPCGNAACAVCAEWRKRRWQLHSELKLRPWQDFSNFTSDEPETLRRHDMLQAASDARKRE